MYCLLRGMSQQFLLLVVLLLIGACSTPGSQTKQIGGNRVAYLAVGKGAPTVVLETGMGPTMATWKPILGKIANFTRVFAYDRPGYGASTTHRTPKSAGEIARNLRRNLQETGQVPPYVLVGHSAGGLYVNAFARIFPNDVVGVVMIDSSHPAQFEYQKQEMPITYALLNVSGIAAGPRSYELSVLKQAGKEFKSLGPFPNVPLTVLTAGKSMLFESKAMRRQWLKFQKNLADLSPQAMHTVVPNSTHFIHKTQPDVVVEAIRRIVVQAKGAIP